MKLDDVLDCKIFLELTKEKKEIPDGLCEKVEAAVDREMEIQTERSERMRRA